MLIEAGRSILVIIDVQKKLMPAIHSNNDLMEQILILQKSAKHLDIPIIITEQYPRGLGNTIDQIMEIPNDGKKLFSKLTFSAMKEESFNSELHRLLSMGRDQVVVCGAETHVCVMQTAVDCIRDKFSVFVVIDAVGSRSPYNKQAGLDRMASCEVQCVTSEMVIFEWLTIAGTSEFKILSKLIK